MDVKDSIEKPHVYKILVVDDNNQNLELLGGFLSLENYDVKFANNGTKALSYVNSEPFDLVLLDINMPDLSGFEVCQQIRSNAKFENLPIIFLSANSDRASILKGFELGGQDYVSKPFDLKELLVRVKTHLDLKTSVEKINKANQELELKVKERTQHLDDANQKLTALNDELLKAKEKIEASDRMKTVFLQNISHEIRTPLNGILGFAEMLAYDELSPNVRLRYFEILRQNSQRLVNTVTDFVDASLLVTDGFSVNLKKVSLRNLLQAIQHQYLNAAKFKNLQLSLKCLKGADDVMVLTDEDLLRKVVNHLVDNSIKFTEQGEINIGVEPSGNDLVIYVQDTGVGIKEEALDAVLDYFEQESAEINSSYEGSGLGLSIVYGITKILNCKLKLSSKKTEGTRVEFIIDNDHFEIIKANSDCEEKDRKSLKRILVAEDDDINFLYLDSILKSLDVEVTRAENGLIALNTCKDDRAYDLILMDIKMPQMDGLEAAREIRKFNDQIVIVAQTAYGLSGDKEKALSAGCNEYLSKPVSKTNLFDIVSNYFNYSEK